MLIPGVVLLVIASAISEPTSGPLTLHLEVEAQLASLCLSDLPVRVRLRNTSQHQVAVVTQARDATGRLHLIKPAWSILADDELPSGHRRNHYPPFLRWCPWEPGRCSDGMTLRPRGQVLLLGPGESVYLDDTNDAWAFSLSAPKATNLGTLHVVLFLDDLAYVEQPQVESLCRGTDIARCEVEVLPASFAATSLRSNEVSVRVLP